MRARNIKPNLFKNELLGIEDPVCTILFIGLWCLADRDGKLEDRPLRIKAELFPYREKLDINRYLTVIERLGFILRYKVDNIPYILIPSFKKHQHVHNTEKPSEIPDPNSEDVNNKELTDNNGEITVKQPLGNGYKPSDILNTDILKSERLKTDICENTLAYIWNTICINLPKVKELSLQRKEKEKLRLKERSVEEWKEVFVKLNNSKFCKGEGNTGWKATYDWIISNADNSIKVLEGKYDGTKDNRVGAKLSDIMGDNFLKGM